MENRVYNFAAGPATLPLPVLERAQEHLLSLPGVGISALELGHRSKPFAEILAKTAANIRKLLNLSNDFDVLFLQGGARLQFLMVPMNHLGRADRSANYIVTGSWGKMAFAEAKNHGIALDIWNGEADNFARLPNSTDLQNDDAATYVHFTSNETIQGLQFRSEPETGGVPLVCDASSDFMSRPIAVERYGMIYAGAQKNAGPAGVTVVIVHRDFLESARSDVPSMLSYKAHADAGSLLNTPPVFAIYIVSLVTDWLLNDIGGLEQMAAINAGKARQIYDVLDDSAGFFRGCVAKEGRSHMNVTFRLADENLELQFLQQAQAEGLAGLKGHRSVGGIRVSLYNAMSLEGVIALRDFMRDFQARNG